MVHSRTKDQFIFACGGLWSFLSVLAEKVRLIFFTQTDATSSTSSTKDEEAPSVSD